MNATFLGLVAVLLAGPAFAERWRGSSGFQAPAAHPSTELSERSGFPEWKYFYHKDVSGYEYGARLYGMRVGSDGNVYPEYRSWNSSGGFGTVTDPGQGRSAMPRISSGGSHPSSSLSAQSGFPEWKYYYHKDISGHEYGARLYGMRVGSDGNVYPIYRAWSTTEGFGTVSDPGTRGAQVQPGAFGGRRFRVFGR